MKHFFLFSLLFSSSISIAQIKKEIIRVGDEIPNIMFKNILNFPNDNAKLSDFDDKLIILDFWNRYCSSCIAMFPKVERYMAKLNGKLIAFPITTDSPQDFYALKSKSQIIKESRLPFVLNDSIIKSMFPHTFVPYYVWIKDRKFIASSGPADLTIENINRALEGKPLVFFEKKNNVENPIENFDSVKSRMEKRRWNNITYYSLLKHVNLETYKKYGISSRIRYDTASKSEFGRYKNGQYLIDLVAAAYNIKIQNIMPTSPDLYSLFKPNSDASDTAMLDFYEKNLYNYEIALDPGDFNSYYRKYNRDFLQNDLLETLGIDGKIDTVLRNCYILKRINYSNLLFANINGGDSTIISEKTKEGFYIKNGYIHTVMRNLSKWLNGSPISGLPIVDETNIKQRISMIVNCGNCKIEEINLALGKYGLNIEYGKRYLKTLLLSRSPQQLEDIKHR